MLKKEFFEIYTQAEILHLSKSAVNINNENIESYYGAVHKRFSININTSWKNLIVIVWSMF